MQSKRQGEDFGIFTELAHKKMKIHLSLILCSFLAIGNSNASQCPPASIECAAQLKEEQVYIAAFFTGLEKICSQNNPALSEKYKNGLAQLMAGEGIEIFHDLKKSESFPAALSKAELEIKQMPTQKLNSECLILLNPGQ